MKHVETNYVYQNKKLGYTVDVKKGGYSITMDSNDVFLMYKPYLQSDIETEEEYEKLAIKHVRNIADGNVDQFVQLEKKQRMLLLTDLFVTMYVQYLKRHYFSLDPSDVNGSDLQCKIEILLYYEVLIGERHLAISCDKEPYGVNEFFFPKILHLVLERNFRNYTLEQIENFEKDIKYRCNRYNNDADKRKAIESLRKAKQKLLNDQCESVSCP